MSNVDGNWDTVTKSPMGDQKATLTVTSNGDSFTGSYVGALGSTEISDGKVDGSTLSWSIDMTVPMPMKLDCKATVDGDAMDGTVTAGMFGTFPMSGVRV